jgi:hypothetical protein
MLSDTLQKLILSGKAQYNTFIAGGTEKAILNVPNDRFIIITSINWQGPTYADDYIFTTDISYLKAVQQNFQMRVFSDKSNNAFLFRCQWNVGVVRQSGGTDKIYLAPAGITNLETYLIHESDVSFTFSLAPAILDKAFNGRGATPAGSIAYPPPFDYGKDGQAGVINVRLRSEIPLAPNEFQALGGDLVTEPNLSMPKEFVFPVASTTRYPSTEPITVPIVNVGYVMVYGNPSDISGTF